MTLANTWPVIAAALAIGIAGATWLALYFLNSPWPLLVLVPLVVLLVAFLYIVRLDPRYWHRKTAGTLFGMAYATGLLPSFIANVKTIRLGTFEFGGGEVKMDAPSTALAGVLALAGMFVTWIDFRLQSQGDSPLVGPLTTETCLRLIVGAIEGTDPHETQRMRLALQKRIIERAGAAEILDALGGPTTTNRGTWFAARRHFIERTANLANGLKESLDFVDKKWRE